MHEECERRYKCSYIFSPECLTHSDLSHASLFLVLHSNSYPYVVYFKSRGKTFVEFFKAFFFIIGPGWATRWTK